LGTIAGIAGCSGTGGQGGNDDGGADAGVVGETFT
jgi:hypothetical protein